MNPENRKLLPKIAFTSFSARFKEPTVKEGFEEIVRVNFKVGVAENSPVAISTFVDFLRSFHFASPVSPLTSRCCDYSSTAQWSIGQFGRDIGFDNGSRNVKYCAAFMRTLKIQTQFRADSS